MFAPKYKASLNVLVQVYPFVKSKVMCLTVTDC